MEYTKEYFDVVTDRRNTYCAKYDSMSMFFGDNDDLVPMWIADMEFRCPEEINAAIRKRVECGIFGYGVLNGAKYRHLVVEWQRERHGIEYEEGDVFFARSSLVGLRAAVQALTAIGDNVAMLNPTYSKFYEYTDGMKRNVVLPELVHEGDTYYIDFEGLDRCLAEHDVKLLVFCNPHNPVGRVWTPDELGQVVEVCKKRCVPIVVDEVHAEFIMPGYTFTPFTAAAREYGYEEMTITISSIGKGFNCAGINCGYYLAHGEEMQAKLKEAATFLGESELLGSLSYLALEQGYRHGGQYLDVACSYIWDNYQYVCEHLRALPCADKISITKLEGSYLMWLELKDSGLGNLEAMMAFAKHGVALESGREFFVQDGTFVRLNLAAPRALIEKATERACACLNDIYA